jgi:hypothetical protein
MPEVRRRRVSKSAAPVRRRRDREAPDVEETDEDVEEIDATERPTKKTAARVVTRHSVEDDADEDEEEWDEEDEEEEEPEAEIEDEDEEPEPPRRRAPKEDELAPRRQRRQTKLPPGVKTGIAGVEEVRKAGSGGADRLALAVEPELIKILEAEPFASFRQHWAPTPGGESGTNRPFICIGKAECPLCALGDNASQTVALNILHLSAPGAPENKLLQVGIRAWKALQDAAWDKRVDRPRLQNGFFAVNRSGSGTQSQTNFRLVKQRDLEEDWPEILNNFELTDLPVIIEEAKAKKFDPTIFQSSTRAELLKVARYLAADE